MSLWSGLGMNIGGDFDGDVTYPTAEVTADLAYLKSIGITKLRVSLAAYADTGGITNMQTLAVAAKAAGFYVSYGVTAGTTMTSTLLTGAYQTSVLAQASWAQSNNIDEFQVGNELENNIDGSVTQAQIRSWVRSIATTVKTNGFTGKVSYSMGQGYSDKSAGWVSDGNTLGGLDYIALNVYGDYETDGNLGFEYYINQMLTVFSTSVFYLSEFNVWYTWPTDMTSTQIANQVTGRLKSVMSLTTRANFFCWRFASDQFSCKLANGDFHPMWPVLIGQRPWFTGIPNVAISRGSSVARGATGSRSASPARAFIP